MTGYPLAERFPPATEAEWRARAPKLEALIREGIEFEPLYGVVASVPHIAGRSGRWTVYQRVDHATPARANAQALEDVEGGAGGLTLCIAGCITARGQGIPIPGIAEALTGVALHRTALKIDAGPDGLAAARALATFIRSQPLNPELLAVNFGLNPLGVIARRGAAAKPWPAAAEETAAFAQEVAPEFLGPIVAATGRVWHEWGATAVQELGLTLAVGVSYLRLLEPVLAPERLAPAVSVTLAATQDTMATLAKFRAMRLLWMRVLGASRLARAPLDLHAETSYPMMAARDPHTNILRCVAAAAGAGLGGATSICVLPFSIAQGLPNSFARRVARNLQHVLLEESNLWQVDDPASGAGAVEHLTRAMAEESWAVFQEIERRGGLAQALVEGSVKEIISRNPGPPPAPRIGVSVHPLEMEYEAAVELGAA